MSNYGIIGYDVTIEIVVKKTISIDCRDESEAIELALLEFKITNDDWNINDAEIVFVEPDYIDDGVWYGNDWIATKNDWRYAHQLLVWKYQIQPILGKRIFTIAWLFK